MTVVGSSRTAHDGAPSTSNVDREKGSCRWRITTRGKATFCAAMASRRKHLAGEYVLAENKMDTPSVRRSSRSDGARASIERAHRSRASARASRKERQPSVVRRDDAR